MKTEKATWQEMLDEDILSLLASAVEYAQNNGVRWGVVLDYIKTSLRLW